jgi:C1A family cysteine protease
VDGVTGADPITSTLKNLKIMNRIYVVAALAFGLVFMAGCKKDNKTNNTSSAHGSGYNSSTENVATIPKALNTHNLTGTAATNLPSSYFLYNYLPPVGDQGQYGTCIGWSTAYYTKTALEAVANNYSAAQLASTDHQMSAKDLFTAIADNLKGADCNGTNYDAALTVIQTRGVATLTSVPYSTLGNCAQSGSASGTDAGNHKITTYRALSNSSVSQYIADVKQNLVNNLPVMVGVGEGPGFQNWTGSGVMTAGFDPCGGGNPCGGHAQTIVGYDDSKGAGGAFRVVNSWNTTWGDNGYYWVDYNFMFNTLALKDNSGQYSIFVASNSSDTTAPNPNQTPTSGVDLAPWVESDVSTTTGSSPTRQAVYNVYNLGTAAANASSNWGLYYVYYNAYNANDYGVIFYDAFDQGVATYQCSSTINQCEFNLNIPAGSDFATAAFGSSTLYQNYTMPSITGYYALNDADYENNIFYVNYDPAYFASGYAKNGGSSIPDFTNNFKPDRNLLKKSVFNTAVTRTHPNAYTPREIKQFIRAKKASGELDAKVRSLQSNVSAVGSHH